MQKAIQIAYNDTFEKKCAYAAEAGFKHIAVGFAEVIHKNELEWAHITEHIQSILDKNDLRCVQSHLYYYDLRISSEIIEDVHEFDMKQSIIATAKLGGKWCVCHPRSSITSGFDTAKSLEDNRAVMSEYLECAIKAGTGIAVENLPIFSGIIPIIPFYSSNYHDLIQLADSFRDEHMKICWDFGHANMMSFDQSEAIRTMGERIVCTHIHNNFKRQDLHLPPDCGDIDWEAVMTAMKENGYDGPLTLETHCLYPEDGVLKSFARHNLECLKYLERFFG